MIFLFFSLIQLKIIQQILFNLYLWQLKEYRLDRFLEHINRLYPNKIQRLLAITIFSPFKLPRKTVKAILLFLINLFLNYLFFIFKNLPLAVLALFLTPLIFLFSLILIYPLETTIRLIIYQLASKKIAKLQKKFGLIVIGITGSYGKTTTKTFLNQILSLKFNTLTTPKSVNTPLAVSLLSLKKLNQNSQFFIVEMGAYKIGEIKELCQIVHPQIAIITAISNQHLALFGDQKNIIKAKSELIQALPTNGLAIINKQSPFLPPIPKRKKIEIIYYQKPPEENLGIPSFLKINLQPALILAKRFGIEEKKIHQGLRTLCLPKKTMNQLTGFKKAIIIDDSLNSNLEGTMAAFDHLKKFKGKKIVVMPCLIELGKEAFMIHQKIGKKLAEVANLAIITTDDYRLAIEKGVGEKRKIFFINNPKKVIALLKKEVTKNSVVLIEGKVHLSIVNFLTNELAD